MSDHFVADRQWLMLIWVRIIVLWWIYARNGRNVRCRRLSRFRIFVIDTFIPGLFSSNGSESTQADLKPSGVHVKTYTYRQTLAFFTFVKLLITLIVHGSHPWHNFWYRSANSVTNFACADKCFLLSWPTRITSVICLEPLAVFLFRHLTIFG